MKPAKPEPKTPETRAQRIDRMAKQYVELAGLHGMSATIRFLVECIVDLQKKP